MLHISAAQMSQFADHQRLRTLRELCERLSRSDPALTQGRLIDALMPVAIQSDAIANHSGMETVGAVAIIMTLLLVVQGDRQAAVNLQPLFNILKNDTQSEINRLEAVNLLLFDLDESMPPELRRQRFAIRPTPELDV